jgi:hypothetical protein
VETENYIEITSGISADDKVVVRSGTFVEDGAQVEIVGEE